MIEYHIFMPYVVKTLAGEVVGDGMVSVVLPYRKGTTRSNIFDDAVAHLRSKHSDRIVMPTGFVCERNDLG